MSDDMHVMNGARPSVRELEERRRVAARHAEDARKRSKAAAIRQSQLAQARADLKLGKHDVTSAGRAAIEALARSAEAHRHCAEAQEESARLHERAAQLADELGQSDKAARYRQMAATAHKAAEQAAHLAEADEGQLAGEDRAITGQA